MNDEITYLRRMGLLFNLHRFVKNEGHIDEVYPKSGLKCQLLKANIRFTINLINF